MDVYSNKCWGTAKFRSISNNSRLSTGTNRRNATCHGTRGGSDNNLAYTTNLMSILHGSIPTNVEGPKFRSIPNNPRSFDRNASSILHVPWDERRERQNLAYTTNLIPNFCMDLYQQMLRDLEVSEHFEQSSIFRPKRVLHHRDVPRDERREDNNLAYTMNLTPIFAWTSIPTNVKGLQSLGAFRTILDFSTGPSAPIGHGKTNLSHDGLNPAHVPYWWVNNPTLGEFCFTMIGRADIEGSKSNVAMNAWLPQASYPCGNFSDTSSFKFRRSKGSIGHAFTVRIRTGNQNQTSFYPFVPHEISVLVELILGHLRYLLTDVPPQPNSPPDNVFRPDRPTKVSLGSKKRGSAPPPIHEISKITLKVVVFHFRCFQLPLILHLSSHFTKSD
ncbi:hypothetical protein KIW84_035551 [Lathyrus oleraceus]|uniref:Senescence-associated protein n=2 Tax=Pisum sativum TaxID=3888 RepID=A0A9D5B652_PEA|nr:hypothetical protein KIW84_035551 [Pisum sativum]